MKESYDIEERDELLKEVLEKEDIKNKKEIKLSIFNPINEKIENYKLLNEKEELLLCKEETINEIKSKKENKEEDIKIKELYIGEDSDSFYYLNKKEIKQKLIQNSIDLEKNFENSIIDNQNREEMDKLYKEVQLKHPRKIIDGEIKRYSFFEWSGFFCCNKKDYLNLGLGFITYFNTLKLLILFFFIIAMINSSAIAIYIKYNSIYDVNHGNLLRTTLGNTLVGYLNTTSIHSTKKEIQLDCKASKIGNIIAIIRYYNVRENELNYLNNYSSNSFDINFINHISKTNNNKKAHYHDSNSVSIFNQALILKNCSILNKCNLNYSRNIIKAETHNKKDSESYHQYNTNITDLFIYSCIPEDSGYKINNNEIKNTAVYTTFITLIIIIIFYITYNKSVSKDKKSYEKNKTIINDYTLILHGLEFRYNNYNEDLNDLISFLNDLIQKSNLLFIQNDLKSYSEFKDLNIFDFSISQVNEKKIETFNKIKTFQEKIKDIEKDNDSLKDKLKNSVKGLYNSMQNILANLSDKNGKKENEENNIITKEDKNIITNDINEPLNEVNNKKDDYDELKLKKINTQKFKLLKEWNKITFDINKLHEESKLSYYADIYITFRNQVIAKYIYEIYKKGKFIRFCYHLFCQGYKIQNYYFKNQWLKFRLSNDNPSDIQWENCYISTKMKWTRRTISFCISFSFIMIITAIITSIKAAVENNNNFFLQKLVTIIVIVVNICSGFLLKILTRYEKYSSKTKDIFWDIAKYYWLNFLVSGVTIQFHELILPNPIFCYENNENYFTDISIILDYMIFQIFTAQLSPLFSYGLNLLKRFSDSKYSNGKTTLLTEKKKYEEIYLGPDFPLSDRYSIIFINFCICLLYGPYCPVIYFFFLIFLIVTFTVDKFLMIHFYKKPPFYGSFIAKRARDFWMWGVFILIYGIVYNISNPNLFNFETLKESLSEESSILEKIFYYIYYTIFPISIVYLYIIYFLFQKLLGAGYHDPQYSFMYFNFKPILLLHFLVFIFFLEPISVIKRLVSPKNEISSFLKSTAIEIGSIYSLEDLKKYYEIKKIQLFNLIIDLNNTDKNNTNISNLINNHISVLNYLRHYINEKSNKQKNVEDIIISEENTKFKQNSISLRYKYQLNGDISYNQSFIPKYDIYSNFTLLKNI